MATGKNVFVLFSQVSDDILKNSEAEILVKMRRKGALVPLSVVNDVKVEALAGAPAGESMADAAKAAGYVVEPIAAGSELSVVEDLADEAALLAELDKAFALASTKMIIVVVTPTMALFYGLGIERNLVLDKPLPAASIAPTLAWLGDLPLPAQVEAAPAYAVIKGLNFKAKEIAKLKDANDALMLKIERDNRKPWDKHDCA
ncbi:hypothetical protein [Mailhella massiliensis]|uniref:Uncharacterized protein n=1 Tax=Mailhella massiliensis TaxID=1903261 RepID=A0A921AXK9_9BACT|nr:hypothetical protein [Mailhella massiliensis]HJD98202.1 hypothetical protein [Mailhella massiliensis]